MQAQQVYVDAQVAYMRLQIQASCFDPWQKEELLSRFNLLQLQHVVALCNTASSPISATNMRYMLCFLINMPVKDISMLFNVDVRSVYSVRYRLRRLFTEAKKNGDSLPSVLPF